jgi:hypothetical protein
VPDGGPSPTLSRHALLEVRGLALAHIQTQSLVFLDSAFQFAKRTEQHTRAPTTFCDSETPALVPLANIDTSLIPYPFVCIAYFLQPTLALYGADVQVRRLVFWLSHKTTS